MKQWKKTLVLMMLVCLAIGQCIVVQATAKSSKYKVTMNKTSYTMKKGTSFQLKATKNAAAKSKKVAWSSSNAKIAAVSNNGKVSAKKNGKATITAKLSGTKEKATCKIVVGTPVKSIKFSKKPGSLEVGKTFQLKYELSPKKPTNKKISFKSSKKSIATVSSDKGLIKAKKAGTTKITATAADGTGKSASCTVTVKNVAVNNITLNKSSLTLVPGQTEKLSASVMPSNAKNKNLVWSTSDSSIVTVNNGTITAVNEGTAEVNVKTDNNKTASCSIKVSYKGQVSNQEELNLALTSKMVSNITYTSNSASTIEIPSNDYPDKTLEINAPNADVTNNGHFEKVTINAIAENTYREHSHNVIYFNAPKGHIVIAKNASATINLGSSANQDLYLENNGYIADVSVLSKAVLKVGGSVLVPITLGPNAADSSITASTELKIIASVKWHMTILPGAENTKATVNNHHCIPSITGIGRIPVTVEEDNDVINITAEMDDDLKDIIDQTVRVTGNVQEYNLQDAENEGEDENEIETYEDAAKRLVRSNSAGANIYLLPYTAQSSDLNAENYKTLIRGIQESAVTDENGDFSVENISIGNYWMIVEKDGYVPVVKNIMIASNNSATYTCSSTVLLSNEIADSGVVPEFSGTIIDSLTGRSVNVSGIQVKLRAGFGNVIGDVLMTTLTDDDGNYSFKEVPAGAYTIEVLDLRQDLPEDTIRYNSASKDIVVAAGYPDDYNCQIDQKMFDTITGQGQVQFTLTWGKEESGASADIDSHLIGPRGDGNGVFHTYYSDKQYYFNDVRMADLDVDDINWEGPEHTTIYQESNGIYKFYIHNYSESGINDSEMLAKSSVQVRVTIGENSHTFNCPNQKGNLWYVCNYDPATHTIYPVNEMSSFLMDEAYIGLSEDEYNQTYLERQKNSALSDIRGLKEYLLRFSDNDAKDQYLSRIDAYKEQIDNAENTEDIGEIRNELERMQDELSDIYYYRPYITADNLFDYDYNIKYGYDDDDDDNIISESIIADCETNYGNTLTNFTVTGRENQTVTWEETSGDYAYVIHVINDGGLAYDIWVKILPDESARRLSNKAQDCKKVLSQFEENDDILNAQAQLSSILDRTINNEDDYEEAYNELQEIEDKYQQISRKFSIENVSIDCPLSDWWNSTYDAEDDDENWIRTDALLYLERYEDDTDEDILSASAKMGITFAGEDDDDSENISYEIVESDNERYPEMIRVTDGQYTKKIYIRITEW